MATALAGLKGGIWSYHRGHLHPIPVMANDYIRHRRSGPLVRDSIVVKNGQTGDSVATPLSDSAL